MDKDKDTVSNYFVRAALAHLAPEALPGVLRTAGIPAEMMAHRQARVPARAFAALWLAVARQLDDEFFGLDSRRMKVGSFALMCHAVLHCGTLGRALRQCLRSFSVFLDDLHGELAIDGDRAVITLRNRIADPADRRFAEETYLVMVHGLMCWLIGRRIQLTHIAFGHAQPEEAREYRVMYGEALEFGAERTTVRFDAALLEAPVIQTEATLKGFLRSAPQSVFLKYKSTDSWTARVRRRLRRCLGGQADWPTLDDLAGEFHVAPSTLRRRLEAEGGTYQSAKDDLRRDAAIHHLCHSRLSIAEISTLLGFQEPSAFHRAFKKWTGSQPGEYRTLRAEAVSAPGAGPVARRPAAEQALLSG